MSAFAYFLLRKRMMLGFDRSSHIQQWNKYIPLYLRKKISFISVNRKVKCFRGYYFWRSIVQNKILWAGLCVWFVFVWFSFCLVCVCVFVSLRFEVWFAFKNLERWVIMFEDMQIFLFTVNLVPVLELPFKRKDKYFIISVWVFTSMQIQYICIC